MDYTKLLSRIAEQGLKKTRFQTVALFEGRLAQRVRSLLDPKHSNKIRLSWRSALLCTLTVSVCFLAFGTVRLAAKTQKETNPKTNEAKPTEVDTSLIELRRESDKNLRQFGLFLASYADEHQGKFPDSLQELLSYGLSEDFGRWLQQNVKYRGKGKTNTDAPRTGIAYDNNLLQAEADKGTNVLFIDGHVKFVEKNQLQKLRILPETNLAVMDIQIEPIRQGKNVVRVKVKNNSEDEQMFRIQIYTRSPDYGRHGIGWGTSFFDVLKPKEMKWTRYAFKIQGPITDATYVRLDFHNPGLAAGFDVDKYFQEKLAKEWFKRVRYSSIELDQHKSDNENGGMLAPDDQANAVKRALKKIQNYIRNKEYKQAWNLFTKDYQQAEYQFYGFEQFKKAMEPAHPLDSGFTWEKEKFLKLKTTAVVMKNGLLALSAMHENEMWIIGFVKTDKEWKIDQIGGYTPGVLRQQDWQKNLLPRMEQHTTKHFDIYYYKDSTAENKIDQIAEQKEKGFEEICKFLGKVSDVQIRLVFFEDGQTKLRETGHQGAGWAFGNTIVEVYNDEQKLDPYHETTHVLMRPYGNPPALFNEGFATYMSEKLGSHALANLSGGESSIYQRVRELKNKDEWIPLEELITYTDIGPGWSKPPISYPEAASFVKFLIDKYGKNRFLQAYRRLKKSSDKAIQQQNVKILEEIYDKSLSDLKTEWENTFLASK